MVGPRVGPKARPRAEPEGIGLTLPAPPGHLRCRGTAALEFAIVCGAFLPLAIGTVEVGLVLWTQNALQTAAELTARCVAIKSPDCSANAQQFALSTAQSWAVSGISTAQEVQVTPSSSCNGAPGSFTLVTISSNYWAGLPGFFAAPSLSATACYPVAH